jgi:hypothetical protein
MFFGANALAEEYEYFAVMAEAMSPLDSTIEFDCFNGYLQTTSASTLHSSSGYIAQINLPDGAEIVSATGYGYDTDSSENMEFSVLRYRFNGDSDEPYESITWLEDSSGDSGAFEKTAVALEPPAEKPGLCIVNNKDFSYGLYCNIPPASSGKLYVVRFVVKAKLAAEESQTRTQAVVIPMF